MHFGLYAPIPMVTVGSPQIAQAAAQARQPLAAGDRDQQFDFGLALLQAADTAGFELALFAERHLGGDMGAWVLASAVASRLERIRALVAVHPGLWDPAIVAKLAVSLDRICKGRTAINIVNGWFDREFEMFGGQVLKGDERYERAAEFIAILRGLWTNDSFSYKGLHYSVGDGELLLKPATRSPPEIFSVSASDAGRAFIAANCDWWFIDFPKSAATTSEALRGIEGAIADMRQRAERAGRTIRYALNPFLSLGADADAALSWTMQEILAHDPKPDVRKLELRMLPATKAGCMGDPAQVRRQIRRFEDMGVELLLLKMIPTIENARRIGGEIIAPLRHDAEG